MNPVFKIPKLQAEFDENGFVKTPFLKPDQIAFLTEFYDKHGQSPNGKGFHATMQTADFDYRRKIDSAIKEAISLNVEDCLLNYRPLFANFIVKEPQSKGEVGIHQDWNYVDEEQFISVNIWCPLVDTNETNGGLKILRGSHRLQTPLRYTPYEICKWEKFNPEIREAAELIETKAGDAIIYNTKLIHFSDSNMSDKPRVAIAFVNIPINAQPLHYFKIEGENQLELFEVDDDFFSTHLIGKRPKGYRSLGRVELDDAHFTEHDFSKILSLHS
jgi:hypothetical protein